MSGDNKAVFLDRDGVLNKALVYADGSLHPPCNLDELEILPGAAEACNLFKQAGFLLIVATNQPDVARGKQQKKVVEAINALLKEKLPLDDIRVCYHDDIDCCQCRKPFPGLLIEASKIWGVSLTDSFMVGDRWKDIEAGRRAGCRTILVSTEQSEADLCAPDYRVRALLEATTWIFQNKS